jgi:hypothetical protein
MKAKSSIFKNESLPSIQREREIDKYSELSYITKSTTYRDYESFEEAELFIFLFAPSDPSYYCKTYRGKTP